MLTYFSALRLVIAAYIVYAGLQSGSDALGVVAGATLTVCTLDTFNGHLAHAAPDPEPRRLGRHERYIDTVMILAGFLYLALIGMIPALALVTYLLANVSLLLHFGSVALLTALERLLAILIFVSAVTLLAFLLVQTGSAVWMHVN